VTINYKFWKRNKNMKIEAKVWSNSFFLVPILLSISYHLYFHALLVLAAMTFSTVYHLSSEKRWGTIDKIFAYLVIVYNLYLCYLSDFNQPYFSFALLFVFTGFYFFFKMKKDDYEWHISCVLITTFCILAYAI